MSENYPLRRKGGSGDASDPLLRKHGHSAELVFWDAVPVEAVIPGYPRFSGPRAWRR